MYLSKLDRCLHRPHHNRRRQRHHLRHLPAVVYRIFHPVFLIDLNHRRTTHCHNHFPPMRSLRPQVPPLHRYTTLHLNGRLFRHLCPFLQQQFFHLSIVVRLNYRSQWLFDWILSVHRVQLFYSLALQLVCRFLNIQPILKYGM